MATKSSGGSSFDNTETRFGGADAVPDTPDVAGHGTEPEQHPDGAVRAIVGAGGNHMVAWFLLVACALVLIAYLSGFAAR